MKKTLLLLLAILTLGFSFAATTPAKKAKVKASEVLIPIGNTGTKISLLDLSEIKIKEVETLSGRKMNFTDRLTFKAAQRQLRKSINPDGTINTKRIAKNVKKVDGESGFHVGGFALGFLLGLIGVLIAYLINDDKKSNRTKWAWIGFAAALVLYLLLII